MSVFHLPTSTRSTSETHWIIASILHLGRGMTSVVTVLFFRASLHFMFLFAFMRLLWVLLFVIRLFWRVGSIYVCVDSH